MAGITLYGQYDSPFVRRVAVVLYTYSKPFDHVPLSAFDDFEELMKISPLGIVPVMKLSNGEAMFDSRAIIDFLDCLMSPNQRLTPAENPARHRVMLYEAVALGVLDKVTALRTERYRKHSAAKDLNWESRTLRQIRGGLTWLQGRIGQGWFLHKEKSMADVTTAILITHLRHKLPEALRTGYPGLEQLCDRCEKRPEFRAATPLSGQARASGES
jgi:glutathione S-transferase